MICEDLIESIDVETEDVIEIMKMIKMLSHKICQTTPTVVTIQDEENDSKMYLVIYTLTVKYKSNNGRRIYKLYLRNSEYYFPMCI